MTGTAGCGDAGQNPSTTVHDRQRIVTRRVRKPYPRVLPGIAPHIDEYLVPLSLLQLETLFWDKILEAGIGSDFGALIG